MENFKDYMFQRDNYNKCDILTCTPTVHSLQVQNMYNAVPWITKRNKEHDKNIYELKKDMSEPGKAVLFYIHGKFNYYYIANTNSDRDTHVYTSDQNFLYDKQAVKLYTYKSSEIKEYEIGDRSWENRPPRFSAASPCNLVFHTSTIAALNALIDRYLGDYNG